jgi:hypothetical protein
VQIHMEEKDSAQSKKAHNIQDLDQEFKKLKQAAVQVESDKNQMIWDFGKES